MTRRTAAAVAGSLFLHAAAVWGVGLALRPAGPPVPAAEVEVEVAVPPPEPEAPPAPVPALPAEPARPGPPVWPDARPAPESMPVNEPAPEPAPERDPEPESVREPEPDASREPEPEPGLEPQPEPEPEPTQAAAPLEDRETVPAWEAPGRVPVAPPSPAPGGADPEAQEDAGPPAPLAAASQDYSSDAGPDPEALKAYMSAVRARIEAAKHYPPWARRQGIEGAVTVGFRLTAGGDLADARVVGSSGSAVLDEAALAAVRRGAPYPRRLGAGPEELAVTLVFALR